MFIEIDEMKSVLYEYQMDQIAEQDDTIITDGILAAIAEVKSYFYAANSRRETASLSKQQYADWKLYDVNAIFNATGTQRNAFVTRLVKRVAAYNICELANVDVLYAHLKERYDATIATLEKIAGYGEWANARLVLDELPSLHPEPDESVSLPFRMVSRPKFNHE